MESINNGVLDDDIIMITNALKRLSLKTTCIILTNTASAFLVDVNVCNSFVNKVNQSIGALGYQCSV